MSPSGRLTWTTLDRPAGMSVLSDAQGEPHLALPIYVWFQPLDQGWMLLWQRRQETGRITVQLIQLDGLQRLDGLQEWLSRDPAPADPLFSAPTEFCARAEIVTARDAGRHELLLPPAFDCVPEFLVVAENPALPAEPGKASFCIYAVDPARHSIEVFPQDWFNDGTPDYGYQWITCAARDPASHRLLVGGIRIDSFVLDETGRRIAMRLPRRADSES